MGKIIWYDGRSLKDEGKSLCLVYNLPYENLLVSKEMANRINVPKRMKMIVEVNDCDDIGDCPNGSIILSENMHVLEKAGDMGYMTALYKFIKTQYDVEKTIQEGKFVEHIVLEFDFETNIPLELVIAQLQREKTNILKVVRTATEAEIAFIVMEKGSDGIVLKSEDIKEITAVGKLINKKEYGKIELVSGRVVEISHIGIGQRACIDTVSILEKNEGMVIGSTSHGGLLVSSETHYLPYMELRPFRVNAGAVHSYVLIPDGRTSYLTELKAGSKVMCVDTNGNTRTISVGRVKIEVRPLLKIVLDINNTYINTIVQDDWHIRIFGADGEPRNASSIKEGDLLMSYVSQAGRHVGINIDETIIEK